MAICLHHPYSRKVKFGTPIHESSLIAFYSGSLSSMSPMWTVAFYTGLLVRRDSHDGLCTSHQLLSEYSLGA